MTAPQPTPDERAERFLVAILYPTLTRRLTQPVMGWCFTAAEHYECTHHPRAATIVDWLGDRLDDLGLWANGRKARRRVRRRG